MKVLAVRFLVGGVLSALIACSSSQTAETEEERGVGGRAFDDAAPPSDVQTPTTPDASAPGVPPTAAEACETWSAAFCAAFAKKGADMFAVSYGDEGACRAIEDAGCRAIFALPDIGWTPEAWMSCAAATPAASLSELVFRKPQACRAPAGKRPEGAPCSRYEQCAQGACIRPVGAACGACGPTRGQGQACMRPSDCQDGLDCIPEGDGFACAPSATEVPIGTPCTATADCGAWRYCKGTAVWSSTARTWSYVGGTCQGFTAVRAPEACGRFFTSLDNDRRREIHDVKVCVLATSKCEFSKEDPTKGTCVPLPTLGQLCSTARPCATGTECVQGVCKGYSSSACN